MCENAESKFGVGAVPVTVTKEVGVNADVMHGSGGGAVDIRELVQVSTSAPSGTEHLVDPFSLPDPKEG